MAKQKFYFLTKYALTEGIKKVKGKVSSISTDKATHIITSGNFWTTHKLGRDIHTTLADAQIAAEQMRAKKIASLNKQLDKVRNLKF